jgi:hypothetical protein
MRGVEWARGRGYWNDCKRPERTRTTYLELHPGTNLRVARDRTLLGAYEEYLARLAGAENEDSMRRKHG